MNVLLTPLTMVPIVGKMNVVKNLFVEFVIIQITNLIRLFFLTNEMNFILKELLTCSEPLSAVGSSLVGNSNVPFKL